MPHHRLPAGVCRHREPSLEAIPTVGSKALRTPPRAESCTYDVLPLNVVYERNRTGFEETKEFQVVTNMVIAARYRVVGFLGSAAFSKAVQAWDMRFNQHVCMKIIKNDKDFFDQSLDEIKLLSLLQLNAPDGDIDKTRCLRMIDYFYHKEHLIIVTELLRDNLYEFSKLTRVSSPPQPLSPVPAFGSPVATPPTTPLLAPVSQYFTIGRLQKITHQVLTALEYIHSMGLMHCDLKPENILLQSYTTASVKVIDFGSSCFITDHLATYIQSRCYRAPEVILGLSYDTSIDIWSLGCIVAELWTSTVLFQNDSIQSLLARVIGIIGPFPEHMMRLGKLIPRYFTRDRQIYMEHPPVHGMRDMSTSRSASWDNRQRASPPSTPRLLQILVPKETSLHQRMRTNDEAFLDFITQCLQLDPNLRPTAREALQHPWLTKSRYPDGLTD
ncbi:protein kinase, putative [Perkinsus marinus ATCC 50983]|uniref:Protein kinase, putative n=1 Tax=Perkinsus marinus (strain ATCC 50983 / TXsc) TaxID=423536 RepID=C5K550_PERM5|nr:protein kinase, putative [Perkinsus marinus ATCC 50983]EER20472.1 protein kinase, putative [Perkinsus marinus ATCC 50983]|eukprot:XP_002788676.1 protein kinase, putative [Perkinsus marinus ATCC 50983]